jgi:CheY-like chemotaxis protein
LILALGPPAIIPRLPNNVVLLVDDDPELGLMLATTLELENKQVIVAANGQEAFNLALRHHPAVIVLDLMMPTMSGEEFRNVQVATPEIKNIPVLVVSAHHDGAAIARRMNVDGYLPKPIDFDALTKFVNSRSCCGD